MKSVDTRVKEPSAPIFFQSPVTKNCTVKTAAPQLYRALAPILAVILSCFSFGPASAMSLFVGKSNRPGSFNFSVQAGFVSLEYVDEGRQPYGIPNINRVVNLDVEARSSGRLYAYGKVGLSCSRFGRNGSGNSYHNATGFTGQNVGIGLGYELTPLVALQGQVLWMRYQQVDIPAYERFGVISAGLVWQF
jgi:hypothetical protein